GTTRRLTCRVVPWPLPPLHRASVQIHLALTGVNGQMLVQWATQGSGATSELVYYGVNRYNLNRTATGTSTVLDDNGTMDPVLRLHYAVLTGLAVNTTYFYSIGSANSSSNLFFVNQPIRVGGKRYAVFADLGACRRHPHNPPAHTRVLLLLRRLIRMYHRPCPRLAGYSNDVAVPQIIAEGNANLWVCASVRGAARGCLHTRTHVRARAHTHTHTHTHAHAHAVACVYAHQCARVQDGIVFPGDFAYDLEDNGGQNGNNFMNAIQPFASRYPMMVAAGNHEADVGQTFAQYINRFAGIAATAGALSGSNSNLWYSYNDGLVHFVVIDTELYTEGGTPDQIAAQLQWLQNDLAAVDRSVTPWVIAYGHQQGWMKHMESFADISQIFYNGGVDVYFCGHEVCARLLLASFAGVRMRVRTAVRAPHTLFVVRPRVPSVLPPVQHNYQRLIPELQLTPDASCMPDQNTYLNCAYTTTILVGSPGCDQGLGYKFAPDNLIVTSALAYGFGHLQVVNATHMFWQWEELPTPGAAAGANYADQAWIINLSN
ncbi:hypothetical protein EON66_01105, partial [archaeon]